MLAKFVEHASSDCCCVCPENILPGLFYIPVIFVPVKWKGKGKERGGGEMRGKGRARIKGNKNEWKGGKQ